MPEKRIGRLASPLDTRPVPVEPPFPDWATIRAKVATPDVLPAPKPKDWSEIAGDEDEPR